MTHAVGKCVAAMLDRFPAVNTLRRLGGLYPRRSVDLFFTAAMDSRGEDLSGVVVRDVPSLSLVDVAMSMSRAAFRLRKHGDAGFERVKRQGFVLRWLARIWMRVGGFFLYTLNLWHPWFGMPRDAFGSAAITDVSRFGADFVYPPILPLARLPAVFAVGPVRGRALHLSIVFDHRVIDGVYGGRMLRYLKQVFSAPDRHLGSAAPVLRKEVS